MSTVADYIGETPVAEIITGEVVDVASEPQAVEPTTAITKPPTATDDHYFDQLELLAKMAECSRNRAELQSQLAEIDEERKDIKTKLKSCDLMMQEIASDIADLMANTYIPERKKFAGEPVAKIESDAPGQKVTTVDADWGDGKWREAKTAEVMLGVKGLGAKKLEALADLAPTLGDLEDLRGQCGGVFKTALPHGFGDKVASEIEDRLTEYARKQSNPPASEQVKQNKPAVVDQEESNAVVPLEEVEAMIETFQNDAEIEKWDASDCDLDDRVVALQCTVEMEVGYSAKKAGASIADYPKSYTAGELSDWAWGYVAREVMERIETEDEITGQVSQDPDEFADL